MSRHEAVIAQLKSHAVTAAGNSYSPYSQFPVGAAAISEDGDIYIGCNVENASYSLTQCAERTALTAAVSDGVARSSVVALLIYTPGNRAHPPCGACRQVMHELMGEDSLVVSCCDTDEIKIWNRSEHLPDPFVPEVLLS
jgi:cytidine deaminase